MARIHNTETIRTLLRKAGIQTSHDATPQHLAEKVVPVIDVSPCHTLKLKSKSATDSTSESSTAFSSTRDTWLVAVAITTAKDVNSTSIRSKVTIVPYDESAELNVLTTRYEPTTAGDRSQILILPYPIKLKKGSVMNVQNETAVASIDTTGTAYYYETEPENA